MPINPAAPLMPEMDISLLSGTGQFVPNSPGYPEIDIALLPGVPGQRGPQGPPGDVTELYTTIPSLVSYTHNQVSVATTWAITHNLNFRPNVTVFDSANTMVEGSITHTSSNQLSVSFSAGISGTAYLS